MLEVIPQNKIRVLLAKLTVGYFSWWENCIHHIVGISFSFVKENTAMNISAHVSLNSGAGVALEDIPKSEISGS